MVLEVWTTVVKYDSHFSYRKLELTSCHYILWCLVISVVIWSQQFSIETKVFLLKVKQGESKCENGFFHLASYLRSKREYS